MEGDEWARYLTKYDTGSSWTDYETCEKAVADRLGLTIKCRKDHGSWHGETVLTLVNKSTSTEYTATYEWGSCSGCDTLEGSGPSAACEMIYDEFIEKYPQLKDAGALIK